MRKGLSIAGALCVLAVSATACVERPASDATGGQIYAQVCARCHGADLGGGVGPALDDGSDVASQPDSQVRLTIERGSGRMPAFGSTLSAEQIDRVVGFLRERQTP